VKRLGITQRVEVVLDYGERRDCLDQRWSEFVLELGFIPVPLPNVGPDLAEALTGNLRLDAVLLSGGNTLAELDPEAADTAPERDLFEHALIDVATGLSLPVVGVCRGMQVINLHLGGSLSKVDGHVASRHALHAKPNFNDIIATDANSYHNWGIAPGQLAEPLCPVAMDDEGYTEAYIHRRASISGIMWHPEREQPARHPDVELLKHLLK
jgi:gamma-glutamyl-gamma-aminobutyrate hydrolase PuuD